MSLDPKRLLFLFLSIYDNNDWKERNQDNFYWIREYEYNDYGNVTVVRRTTKEMKKNSMIKFIPPFPITEIIVFVNTLHMIDVFETDWCDEYWRGANFNKVKMVNMQSAFTTTFESFNRFCWCFRQKIELEPRIGEGRVKYKLILDIVWLVFILLHI